jgi:hypothetical protein
VVELTYARTAETLGTAADVYHGIVGALFNIDSIHLVTRLEAVAVALVMVCAVLAASRGCARWRGGRATTLGPPWTRLRAAQGWLLRDGAGVWPDGAGAPGYWVTRHPEVGCCRGTAVTR